MTCSSADLALAARVEAGPDRYSFRTADGVCSKDAFRPAELLLLDGLWDADLGDLLVVEANYGVVGTVLARRADTVHMTESSARSARLCEHNARANGVDAAVDCRARVTAVDRRFDTAAYAPKPYTPVALAKQRLGDALSVLRPGGRLYLAAAPRSGLTRYAECLRRLCRNVETVRRDGDNRLLRAVRPATVDAGPFVTPRHLTPTVDGVDCSLVSVPGVFAASGLDDGTRLLAETTTVADGERVLDCCCGYGALAAYAGRAADCEVWATDDSAVATRCAERSLRASGVDGTVHTADCLDGVADRRFDRVLCNPPTHAGDGVLSTLLRGAGDVLAPGGRLDVVHHRALDLSAHLAGSDVRTLATGDEHVVHRVTR
jgi:16S rRNA (guanine1207-N2)-methyltransferase